MLKPDYLLRISEGAEDIAEKLHIDIMDRIIKRMMIRIGHGEVGLRIMRRLRNNWFSGGNNAGIPYLDNCVLLSEATSGTYTLDLTAYRNAYGNTAHFLFGAGKVNRNSPNGGAWVHIAKVWLE